MIAKQRAWLEAGELSTGLAVYQRKLRQCSAALEAAERRTVDGGRLLIAHDPNGITNYMADMAREQQIAADALLTWRIRGARVRRSIRAIGDVDVSVFARRAGGGGHPGAAGFTTAAPNIAEAIR